MIEDGDQMGFLNWLKRDKKASSSADTLIQAPTIEPNHHLAFVLLSEPQMPAISDLQIDFHQFAPSGQTLTQPETDNDANDPDATVATVEVAGVGSGFLMLMQPAIPDGESESAREYSIGAYNDKPYHQPSHRAHLMVTFFPENDVDAVQSMTTFTALLAATVKASPCTEIYWGKAGATHDPGLFQSFAESGKENIGSLIMLWNGISRAMEDDGRISFLSLGMHQLGLPNIYLIASKKQYGDAFDWLWELLGYVVSRGETITAGDTIGISEDHQLEVVYAPSPIEDGSVVWKIEM